MAKETLKNLWPSNTIRCVAQYGMATTLKDCCDQLNIVCKYNNPKDDWAICNAYVTPEQHTLLMLMMPSDDWQSITFEEDLEEDLEIQLEHKKEFFSTSPLGLKTFLALLDQEAA